MHLDRQLFELFQEKAEQVEVEILSLGLAYTVAVTSDQGMGLAYTWLNESKSCSLARDIGILEGRPARDILPNILESHPLKRSMALAVINALNHSPALSLPEDRDNQYLFDTMGIKQGTKVAMVGYFGPLMKVFKSRGAELAVIDQNREIGDPADFYRKLENWAEVLFLTSTSILNQSTEEILAHTSKEVRTVMLGPSTPMVPEAFSHLPVAILAGTVPVDREKVLQAVRNGAGTRHIQQYSRKVYALLR